MEKALERSDVEIIELDEADPRDPFTPEKLVGVAVLGAFTSLLVYYMFNQIDPEQRDRLKQGAVAALKGQVRRWGDEEA